MFALDDSVTKMLEECLKTSVFTQAYFAQPA
jgi:hypothetical protein